MEELLKKVLFAGVGFAASAAEKVEQVVTDLIEKGKLNDLEGKRIIDAGKSIIDDFFKNTDFKREEFEEKFKRATDEVVNTFHYARQRDLEAVLARLEVIEEKLGIVTPKVEEAEVVETVVAEEVTPTDNHTEEK
jgi:polyhydroxyalkanoate synthesis regulator phasin